MSAVGILYIEQNDILDHKTQIFVFRTNSGAGSITSFHREYRVKPLQIQAVASVRKGGTTVARAKIARCTYESVWKLVVCISSTFSTDSTNTTGGSSAAVALSAAAAALATSSSSSEVKFQ
jgi:hypothetical protein